MSRIVHDGVLVVGAGLAGLSAALAAAPRPVLVVTPAPLTEAASSLWAQGGLAAGLDAADAEQHALDTIAAGAGLVEPQAARTLTYAGAETVERLLALGVPFERDAQGRLVRSLEAAHALPRVARVGGDRAGAAIMAAVTDAARRSPHIVIRDHGRLLGLLKDETGRVAGALVDLDGRPVEIVAPAVVLATGGIGGLYAVTTNPPSLVGEGLAQAALAGAALADLEFVQFHPTALDVGLDPAPLATEALRGEGAILVDREGRRFMPEAHPLAELAPRDIVARAVHAQVLSGAGAFLDAREAVGEHFPHAFPAVYAACVSAGLDPRVQPIPVAPAAHYHMGGIVAGPDGRTSLEGLYAVGECASTGVHGANRLASNSLLEAAAFGHAAGLAAREERAATSGLLPVRPLADLPPRARAELRRGMSRGAGVIRSAEGLAALLDLIDRLEQPQGPTAPTVAVRLVVASALARRESRGAHFRADFPQASPEAKRSFTEWAEVAPAPIAAK